MSTFPPDLQYAPDIHMWAPRDIQFAENVRIGPTAYLVAGLSNIRGLDWSPIAVGDSITAGDPICSVNDPDHDGLTIRCPVSGEIAAINPNLSETPGLIKTDPYIEGWVIEVVITDPAVEFEGAVEGAMSADEYAQYVAKLDQ
ncbi:hypothetical protein ABZ912_23255 [Nonomuraea angiospora]|uniref:glycine cleavage system protein H n=1 Tax=Nonomuraea angiospora TaxID=46172 RepID=UPI0033CA4B61